jgi:hypothetical protein
MRGVYYRLRGYLFVAVLAALCLPGAGISQAQKGKPAAVKAAVAVPQANNEEYTAKIREYTTEKFFLTELVDHLPASDKVPSPDKVIGYVVGTPEKLTYSKDVNRYMRELEKASPRVRVMNIGISDDGREVLAVAISDEASIARLDRIKQINARLADTRTIKDDAEAASLMAETKPIYWATGSIHSGETGSVEMLMELAYRLAVSESPLIQNIRKNAIAMITPITEVDGHDRQVDVYRYRKENPNKPPIPLIYWGRYVAHDNNRDGMTASLRLTQIMLKNFLDWHPVVLHDLHESVPFLYVSTGTGPYNSWLDPIVINEWQELAYNEVEEFAKRGVPGVWTQGFYDGWAPNYMFFIANNHNAIGRFYETFGGGGGADTGERTVPSNQTSRQWFRPNPPLPRVKWSIRNNINLQQSGVLMSMQYTAANRDKMLHNFYLKGKRAVAKATTEGPAAYVFPGDEKRQGNAAELMNVLRRQGCEIHVATAAIQTKDGAFPPGSYIVRMDQPYSRIADMLLDTQYYNVSDPRPYDDTGWTLGALKNVRTVRAKDTAILKGAMTLVPGDIKPKGGLQGSSAVAYAIPANADNSLAVLRYRIPAVKMLAVEDAFEAASRSYAPGSFIIPAAGDAINMLSPMLQELGITAYALNEMPKVATHELVAARIALVHNWSSTQDEGWFRLAFDTLGIPYAYISDLDVGKTPDLKAKYDVIVFTPVRGTAQRVVNGTPVRGEPIPWKATDKYPNLTGPNGAQTDDTRGGMGLEGVVYLKKFVEAGGLLVMVTGASSVVLDYGLIEGITITEPQQLQLRGSILSSVVADKKSPVTYGYDDKLPLYFNMGPIFSVVAVAGGFGGPGGGGGGRGSGAESQTRETGRGSLTDPDVVQGRPSYVMTTPPESGGGRGGGFAGMMGADDARPRILVRWDAEKDLLVSGMLAGGAELAGKPAVIDAPLGKGHILMFANNPFWRMETSGSYMLLFNAAMNYGNLSPKPAAAGKSEDK